MIRSRVAFVLSALCSCIAAAQAARTWKIPLSPCSAANGRVQGMCGTYEVWENRQTQRGRKIKLNLMVIPTRAEKPEPDAVFDIQGGPGASTVQSGGGIAQVLIDKRDLVLVDQRGTGGSNRLDCDANGGIAASFERLFVLENLKACRERLEKIADLRQYTTSIAMDDLDEVRAALGYDRINVEGGSYGSTASLEYLRRHADHVRTVIVQGVVPPSYKLPLGFAPSVQQSLQAMFADCSADETCRTAFPKLREEFDAVLERLAKTPAAFTLGPPTVTQPVQAKVGRDMFVDFLRRILYSPRGEGMLPSAIHAAFKGNLEPYAALCYNFSIRSQESFAMGMWMSVTCSEDVPFITDAEVQRETKGTYMGDFRVRGQREVCTTWPAADVPRTFTDPVRSDRPVLLFSGAHDPAAPPRYAAEAVKYLPNSRHIVIRNAAHGAGGPCVIGLIKRFVDQGSAAGLDASCVEQIKPPAFKTP